MHSIIYLENWKWWNRGTNFSLILTIEESSGGLLFLPLSFAFFFGFPSSFRFGYLVCFFHIPYLTSNLIIFCFLYVVLHQERKYQEGIPLQFFEITKNGSNFWCHLQKGMLHMSARFTLVCCRLFMFRRQVRMSYSCETALSLHLDQQNPLLPLRNQWVECPLSSFGRKIKCSL